MFSFARISHLLGDAISRRSGSSEPVSQTGHAPLNMTYIAGDADAPHHEIPEAIRRNLLAQIKISEGKISNAMQKTSTAACLVESGTVAAMVMVGVVSGFSAASAFGIDCDKLKYYSDCERNTELAKIIFISTIIIFGLLLFLKKYSLHQNWYHYTNSNTPPELLDIPINNLSDLNFLAIIDMRRSLQVTLNQINDAMDAEIQSPEDVTLRNIFEIQDWLANIKSMLKSRDYTRLAILRNFTYTVVTQPADENAHVMHVIEPERNMIEALLLEVTQNGSSLEAHPDYKKYCCPISQTIIRDPVTAADGFTYDRNRIAMRLREDVELKRDTTSPMTGSRLQPLKLYPNHLYKQQLIYFLERITRGHTTFAPDYTCPISQEMLIEPVIAADGHTYEKEFITRWLNLKREEANANNTRMRALSPKTGLLLTSFYLYENRWCAARLREIQEAKSDTIPRTQEHKEEAPRLRL